MPARGRIGEVDRDLAVLHPSRGAGVLSLHAGTGCPLLKIASFVNDQHPLQVTQVLGHIAAHVITDAVGVPAGPRQRCCIPAGLASPACSAILQQFTRGSPASSPTTNARARRRGSTLWTRAPTRSISSSRIPSHRPGSTLWPAATARLSCVVTNHAHQAVAVPRSSLRAGDNDLLLEY